MCLLGAANKNFWSRMSDPKKKCAFILPSASYKYLPRVFFYLNVRYLHHKLNFYYSDKEWKNGPLFVLLIVKEELYPFYQQLLSKLVINPSIVRKLLLLFLPCCTFCTRNFALNTLVSFKNKSYIVLRAQTNMSAFRMNAWHETQC